MGRILGPTSQTTSEPLVFRFEKINNPFLSQKRRKNDDRERKIEKCLEGAVLPAV